MKGAMVFLAIFAIFIAATLAYPDMPIGRHICSSLNLPATDYPVTGVPVTTLIVAVFNGVIYDIVAWLIFTFAEKAKKPKL
jgi:hypothetical protein